MNLFKLFIIIIVSVSSSSAYIYDDRLRNLQSQINDVKKNVDELLRKCRNSTKAVNSTSNEKEFKGVVSTFLQNNETLYPHQNDTNKNSSTSSKYLVNLKEKFQKFFHLKKSSNNSEAMKIKRCLSRSVGRSVEKLDDIIPNDDELKELLIKFLKCLSLHGGNFWNETESTTTELSDLFENYIPSTTPSNDESEGNDNRTEAYLRYLASSKHSVEEVGRPNFSKPDLKKTQEIIDNAKSSIWMTFEVEDETTRSPTTTEEYENIPELPILKRETSKHANEVKIFKKDKRAGLFNGIINSVNDFQYEIPNVTFDVNKTERHEDSQQEVNRLVQKIDIKQQEDLIKFLDQLNEKPKEFKFDIDKYFMLAFDNITKSRPENTEENENDLNVGSRKYFEFDFGSNKRKRNTKDRRIEKLKEQFVNQFKDHRHEKFVDFNKIVEHIHDNHIDNSFLDKTYKLNDGSIKTSELIKPLHLINSIKSPKELKMDMELDEKFNEIEKNDFQPVEHRGSHGEASNDIPYYKTEGKSIEDEIEEFST